MTLKAGGHTDFDSFSKNSPLNLTLKHLLVIVFKKGVTSAQTGSSAIYFYINQESQPYANLIFLLFSNAAPAWLNIFRLW